MAVMTGTNRNRRRPETESAEEAERHTLGIFFPDHEALWTPRCLGKAAA